MEEMSMRVLLALSRNLGRAMSIQDLNKEIRRLVGKAYYANTYNAIQPMRNKGLLTMSNLGRTKAISLNFGSFLLLALLTELEARKLSAFLERRSAWATTFVNLDRTLRDLHAQFAIVTEPDRNLRLNRIEMIVCTPKGGETNAAKALEGLGRRLAIRIDTLPLNEAEFLGYLSQAEKNPIQESLATSIAHFNPQAFWAALARAAAEGRPARASEPISPSDLAEKDLHHNLARFGFPLFGGATQGRPFAIEFIAAAALMSGEPRLREGAAVILSKNRFNARLLAFLAAKYGIGDVLKPLIRAGTDTADKRALAPLLPKSQPRSRRSSLGKTMEAYDAT